MTSWRDTKRQMRRDLHSVMQIPVLYLVDGEDPLPLTVRLHYTMDQVGDLKGTNFHYAERQNVDPQILFMRDQLDKPARGAVVSFQAGEAYRIDNVEPFDDISVKAAVVRLSSTEAAGLPVPEET